VRRAKVVDMRFTRKTVIAAAAGAVLAVGVASGVAVATSDDGDVGVTGRQADQAKQAALAATHGGKANSVERDGENGATWEVEVTKPDGKTVDVRLDESYRVVVIEGDDDSGDQGSDG
jgi:hypothetical protein